MRPAAFLIALLCLIGPATAEPRLWTERKTHQQVEAEFVDANHGDVWLRPLGGPTVNVRMKDLSQADQEYVRKLLEKERANRLIGAPADGPQTIHYGPGRKVAELANPQIKESSGIARSIRQPGMFWTHNDSGDAPRLYLFDHRGRDLGSCTLKRVQPFDWEDIASFTSDGKPYLLVADTGNNGMNAGVHMLYVIEEPPIDPERGVLEKKVPVVKTIYLNFEDDYRNCEAVGIDPTDKTILLVAKERRAECNAYALAWPKLDVEKAHIARRIATLKIRQVTAMDISPDGRRAIVLTYDHAYEYVRGEKEDWATALGRAPREIVMPDRDQGESICYGPDGMTLYLTSERRPCPLFEVPVRSVGPARK